MSQETINMGLLDLVVVEETIFVLAGYAHPDDDWGGDPGFDTSNWDPWDDAWKDYVHEECIQEESDWEKVRIEYNINSVLVCRNGAWSKEKLPCPSSERIRHLPALGMVAINECLYTTLQRESGIDGGEWTAVPRYANYFDIIEFDGDIFGLEIVPPPVEHQLKNETRDQTYSLKKAAFETLCTTDHGLYLAGQGLSIFKDGELHEIVEPDKKRKIALSRTPDIDGSALAVSRENVWVLTREGAVKSTMTLPEELTVTLEVVRFRGLNYIACKEGIGPSTRRIVVGKEGTYTELVLPLQSDDSNTWSTCGNYGLRVYENRIWILGAHHILVSEDGLKWDFIDFSNHP